MMTTWLVEASRTTPTPAPHTRAWRGAAAPPPPPAAALRRPGPPPTERAPRRAGGALAARGARAQEGAADEAQRRLVAVALTHVARGGRQAVVQAVVQRRQVDQVGGAHAGVRRPRRRGVVQRGG